MEQKCSPLMRVTTINGISSVLDKSTKFLEDLSRCFGWEQKNFLTDEDNRKSAQCPIDKNHVMDSHYLEKHVDKCHLKKLGVDVQKDTCQSSCFFYETSPSVISVLSDSGPVISSEVLHSKQTSEERLHSYDNIVEIGKSKRKINEEESTADINATENTSQEGGQEVKSKLELLAEQRDYKRRRQSYRAKNVHITKRTPTDIMREIIENKMQELQQLQEDNKTLSHS